MILDKEVKIKISSKIFNHYKNLGYDFKHGETIKIKVEDLPIKSNFKIEVKCDVCNKTKTLAYSNYKKNTNNLLNPYACSNECAHVANKNKKTCLEKYGDENYNNMNKAKQTLFINYGVTHPLLIPGCGEKAKQTCLLNFGVEHPYQNKDIREKGKETMLERYGVEHNMQHLESFEKNQISGFRLKTHEQTGLKYRGTYEKDFLDYCFDNNIIVENFKSIKYEFDDKIKIYYPDFYLRDRNLIIEIKSDYYYEKHLQKNLAKQKACIEQGYNFIFIINKEYDNLNKIFNF